MLAQFQLALAELTASPERCRIARRDPAVLGRWYELSEVEHRRLAGVVASRGMEANCMLYRANRLAPLALNLPDTCDALGDDLEPLATAYWEHEPRTDVNFLVETARFAAYLADLPLTDPVRAALEREVAVVQAKLDCVATW